MATTGRIVYHGDDETIKKEKREFSLTDEIMELINSGGGGGAINGVKVNGQVVNPDQAGYVGLTIPGVINNLSSNSTTDALSAKQGKVLYEYIQALQHVGHFLALWNTATGLPVTNPETSPYTYNTGDYYIVSNVAAAGGTNYKPNGSSYTINVASTTVESGEVQVNDIYFYDGYERRLLDNSGGGSSIAIDSSLSTTSTNPVQNAVITNRLNQMALDANTKTFWLSNLQDTTTGQAIWDWVDDGGNAIVYYGGMPYFMTAKSATRITLYSKFTGTQNSPSNQSTGFTEQLMWIDNNNNTITTSNTAVGLGAPYLATNQNYSTVYTPLYDGSPATKKYVDDKFAAVPTYSAGTGISISSNTINNTGVTSVNGSNGAVTVNDIKTGSTAPSNPTEGMVWYDTTNDILKVYNGSSWDDAGGGETYTAGDGITIDGNNEISAIPYVGGTDIEVVLGEAKKLPSGYTEVEWMQSDGNSYIDTGIVSEGTDTTETKFQVLGVPSSSGAVRPFFGSMEGNSLTRFSVGTYVSAGGSTPYFFGGWNNTTQLSAADTNVHILQMVGGGSVMLDGVSTSYSHSDRNHPTITSYLFARHGDGDNVQTTYDGNGTKIYYHKQYRGAIQIMELIPCVRDSDDEPGFYDLVNERFLANSGSGTLTAGPEVTYNPVNVINYTGNRSNTKTFFFSGNLMNQSNLETALSIIDWLYDGDMPSSWSRPIDKNPIVVYNDGNGTYNKAFHLEGIYDYSGGLQMVFERTIGYVDDYHLGEIENDDITLSITGHSTSDIALYYHSNYKNFLSTTNNTSYTPTNNYNPATKKYVDDAVGGITIPSIAVVNNSSVVNATPSGGDLHTLTLSDTANTVTKSYVDGKMSSGTTAPSSPTEGQLRYDTTNDVLKVYNGTAWVAVGGGGGGVNIIDVTVATAYNTAAKVGTTTAGNYVPASGDLLMVNFVNGCSTSSAPTLKIDNGTAYNIRVGNTSATSTYFSLGTTSSSNVKVLMYYDGTYYKVWSTQNTTYSGMSQSTASTGTSTTSSLISAKVLNDTIVEKAITLDPNSPLDVTTIRCGTETQYNNLSSKGATTAYLCVED